MERQRHPRLRRQGPLRVARRGEPRRPLPPGDEGQSRPARAGIPRPRRRPGRGLPQLLGLGQAPAATRASRILSKREPRSISFLGVAELRRGGQGPRRRFRRLRPRLGLFPQQPGRGRAASATSSASATRCSRSATAIVASGRHVVVAGDYNIAHKPIDLANPKANEGNPGYLPEERAWMDKYLSLGLRRLLPPLQLRAGPVHLVDLSRARRARAQHRLEARLPLRRRGPPPRGQGAPPSIPAVLGSDHCPVSIDLDI